jgi:predicted dehydrogenase
MKFLIAGLGSIGQRHVRNLRSVLGGEAELSAFRARGGALVINEGMTTLESTSPEAHYGLRSYTDLDRALEEKPDGVFVCTPTALHLEVARKAVARGCAVFMEKPLSDRLDGLSELEEEIARKKTPVLVGYQLRFHPAMKRLKQLISEGALGPILSARIEFGEYLPGMHPYEDYRIGYAARKDLGGGVILCIIHELDALLHLFGDAQRVCAFGGKMSGLEIDVEDVAEILVETNLDGRRIPVSVHLDFIQRPPRRKYRIVGEKAVVEWDYFSNFLRIIDAETRQASEIGFPGFERNQMFIDETKHFIACVQGKETPVANFGDGVRSLRLALAAKESIRTGQVVNPSHVG